MDLTTGSIKEHIRRLSIPVSVGFFFNTMFNVVDTFFAGKISTDALAALTISFPIFFIIIAFMHGLSTGGAALISNALGGGSPREARLFAGQVLSFCLFLSVVVYFLGSIAATPLFRLLGAEGEYLRLALLYIDVIFQGAVFFLLTYSANAILIAHGNSRCIRNFLIVGFFANCLLDPWFLYGGFGLPAMGLRGIALATVLVMAGGSVYMLLQVYRSGFFTGMRVSDFIPDLRRYWQITYQSVPAGLNLMTVAIGIFVITYFVRPFGSDAVAAYGACMRVEQIFLLPTIGLSVANLSIVGQNNGAGRIERIREALNMALFYGLIVMTVGAVVMFFFSGPLISLFTDNTEVIAIGTTYLTVAALTSWSYTILTMHSTTMQGMKYPMFSLLLGLGRQIVLPAIVFYTMTHTLGLGLLSIWLSIFSITWLSALFAIYYVRRVITEKIG
ncbi:MAG: MATE family efflux transporter [Chlamydiia bacterium]|nr:MATE family efflux transporter [Chlamydiia bacterium]